MTRPPHRDDESASWPRWRDAAAQPAVDLALRDIYAQLAADVARHAPTCWRSGKCCRFDTYGHRLYVTGLETAWLLNQLDEQSVRRLRTAQLPDMDGCPFQVDGACSVHPLRPLGCRIYYCDPAAQHWQSPAYELFLADLRTLHDLHQLPYRYMEWRAALAEARLSG